MKQDDTDYSRNAYQEASNFVRQHEALLFQRLNYFLISTAFLVTAFVALAQKPDLETLTVLVGFTGFVLSWLFSAINVHNGRTLRMTYDHLLKIEAILGAQRTLTVSDFPYTKITKEIFRNPEFKFGLKELLFFPVGGCHLSHNGGKGEYLELPAPHTWRIPLLFSVFWVTGLVVRFFSWGLLAGVVAVVSIFLVVCLIYLRCGKFINKFYSVEPICRSS